MAKSELGTKRVCPETGRKFYDLNKNPVVSPYTGKIVPIAAPARSRAETAPVARAAVPEEVELVHAMVRRHAETTKAERSWKVLALWEQMVPKFVKVYPNDYRRVVETQKRFKGSGLSEDEAIMAAFEENAHDLARVGGK